MIQFIQDIFEYRFLLNAVLACILSGISCGIIGTYIVSRRLVFLSGGITHSSFGGIGLAYYFGQNPILGALIFSVISAVSMEALVHKGKVREDSAIGILWSLGMAVGIIFVAMTPGYAPNLMSFLFGNILTITNADIMATLILDVILLAVVILFFRPILYIAFDREYARTQKAPVKFISYLMMVLVAVTIVLSIRLVGIVLLISLLTIPPVIAGSFTSSFKKIMLISVPVAAIGTFLGVFISYRTNIPSGASTIIVLAALLIIVRIICRLVSSVKYNRQESHIK